MQHGSFTGHAVIFMPMVLENKKASAYQKTEAFRL